MNANTLAIGQLAEQFYEPLFKFAMRLSGNTADAEDYTQQTFYLAQVKGHQVRDESKVKSWLFTTLYREFLKRRRHETRFPKSSFEETGATIPSLTVNHVNQLDAQSVVELLDDIHEKYREPLKMFYLEDKPYKVIAAELGLPMGTVMSRLSRGKQELRDRLERLTDEVVS